MARRELLTSEITEDIRSGLGMTELAEKYELSDEGLQGLVSILLDADIISRYELFGEIHSPFDAVEPDNSRGLKRFVLESETFIYEPDRPEFQARVVDVSETGVQVRGIEAELDTIREFVLLGDAYGEVPPIEFEAICRWVTRDEGMDEPLAGFQITVISDNDLLELRKMIQVLELEMPADL